MGERCQDDEDAIGAEGAAFDDLIRVEHEVLAQDRQAAGGARGDKIGVVALEMRRVGQHRETTRAALRIGRRQRDGVEIGADQPAARRGALDLGDEPVAPGGERSFERGDEAARRRRLARVALEVGAAAFRLGGGDFDALALADAGEHVAHTADFSLVMAIIFSSACRAAPLSIVRAARGMPSLRSLALPPTSSPAPVFNSTISRIAPVAPPSSARIVAALSAGSPPLRSVTATRFRPTALLVTEKRGT